MKATYSLSDNKLRLYTEDKLDSETYALVKEAGFIWAPKQKLFVAPKWTPEREDLLIKLCGEVIDDELSQSERAQQRAERFEQYSENRANDASNALGRVDDITSYIPLGQPILVGHHSERKHRRDIDRINNGMRKSIAMDEASKYWHNKADNTLRGAVYKESPQVRGRRIKKIETSKRAMERKREMVISQNRPNATAYTERWIAHYNKRLSYEREQLQQIDS